MSNEHRYFDMNERELVDAIYNNTASRTSGRDAGMADMQRRQIEAIREFNKKSGFQANVMIGLTVVIAVLTVVMVWKG
jgi:hypothetical protein